MRNMHFDMFFITCFISCGECCFWWAFSSCWLYRQIRYW